MHSALATALLLLIPLLLLRRGSREKPGPSRRRWAGHSPEPWRSPTLRLGPGFPSYPLGVTAVVFISPGPSPSQWALPCL
uniref:Uncharacterized protein n=1 Tax=Gorilla gorilla gorilla TaxID=9595 RepID=A0A2I2Z9P0_GORGO